MITVIVPRQPQAATVTLHAKRGGLVLPGTNVEILPPAAKSLSAVRLAVEAARIKRQIACGVEKRDLRLRQADPRSLPRAPARRLKIQPRNPRRILRNSNIPRRTIRAVSTLELDTNTNLTAVTANVPASIVGLQVNEPGPRPRVTDPHLAVNPDRPILVDRQRVVIVLIPHIHAIRRDHSTRILAIRLRLKDRPRDLHTIDSPGLHLVGSHLMGLDHAGLDLPEHTLLSGDDPGPDLLDHSLSDERGPRHRQLVRRDIDEPLDTLSGIHSHLHLLGGVRRILSPLPPMPAMHHRRITGSTVHIREEVLTRPLLRARPRNVLSLPNSHTHTLMM